MTLFCQEKVAFLFPINAAPQSFVSTGFYNYRSILPHFPSDYYQPCLTVGLKIEAHTISFLVLQKPLSGYAEGVFAM